MSRHMSIDDTIAGLQWYRQFGKNNSHGNISIDNAENYLKELRQIRRSDSLEIEGLERRGWPDGIPADEEDLEDV